MSTPNDKLPPHSVPDTTTAIAVQISILNERLLPLIELARQHEVTLRGEKGSSGLVGDVNDLKGGMNTIRRLCWLAVGSGVGTFVTLLATHLKFQIP